MDAHLTREVADVKRTMTGDRVVETLLALTEGDVVWVGTDQWTSLGGFFEKVSDYGNGEAQRVGNDELPAFFDKSAGYEVSR